MGACIRNTVAISQTQPCDVVFYFRIDQAEQLAKGVGFSRLEELEHLQIRSPKPILQTPPAPKTPKKSRGARPYSQTNYTFPLSPPLSLSLFCWKSAALKKFYFIFCLTFTSCQRLTTQVCLSRHPLISPVPSTSCLLVCTRRSSAVACAF